MAERGSGRTLRGGALAGLVSMVVVVVVVQDFVPWDGCRYFDKCNGS